MTLGLWVHKSHSVWFVSITKCFQSKRYPFVLSAAIVRPNQPLKPRCVYDSANSFAICDASQGATEYLPVSTE